MIKSIQASRGVAAIAVVFYHVFVIMQQPEYGGTVLFGGIAPFGLLGVNFFFVLSGFIILLAHQKDFDRPAQLGGYAYRRFVRVYPAYWLYLSGYVAGAALGFGHPDFSWALPHMVSAYALVAGQPDLAHLPLKVAWTLLFEVKFYVLFGLCILNLRVGLTAFAVWVGWSVYEHVQGAADVNEGSPLWAINFIFGMAACWIVQRFPPRSYGVLLAGGVALLVVFGLGSADGWQPFKASIIPFMPLLAAGFMLLVSGIALAERHHEYGVPRFLMLLGDASYSIYLLHSAVISFAMVVVHKMGLLEKLGAYPVYAALFVAASTAGVVAHTLFERPMLDWLRKRMPKKAA